MLFERSTFIGIDPSAGEKPFVYAALDGELNLLALGQGKMEEVLAFTAGQQQAVVAVCAPRQPNTGVMARPEIRQGLTPSPRPGRWIDFRLADFMLRQRGISIPQTPADESACSNWMRMGFTLHRRLEAQGYQLYPAEEAACQVLEVYPFASYTSLLGGVLPFPKNSLEGRVQRQLVLYESKLDISDPMEFFEEITRHRLLKSQLPTQHLYSAAELDALVAAYNAWLAALYPSKVEILGDREEGQVVLPLKN
jgi:hypothetical protein